MRAIASALTWLLATAVCRARGRDEGAKSRRDGSTMTGEEWRGRSVRIGVARSVEACCRSSALRHEVGWRAHEQSHSRVGRVRRGARGRGEGHFAEQSRVQSSAVTMERMKWRSAAAAPRSLEALCQIPSQAAPDRPLKCPSPEDSRCALGWQSGTLCKPFSRIVHRCLYLLSRCLRACDARFDCAHRVFRVPVFCSSSMLFTSIQP